MLVDTHAHLEGERYAGDLPAALARATDTGVGCIINIGTDLKSSTQGVKLAAKYPQIYAAVGLHPHEAQSATPEFYQELEVLAKQPKVVAIGEIGLDYHYLHSPRDAQQQAFLRQLDVADTMRLPVVIHQREAQADTLAILKGHPPRRGGVMHCFGGDEDYLSECLALGLYISLTGIVTFKGAGELVKLVSQIPLDRLLLETDAPYLAPVPYRGKRNEPAYVSYVAAQAAHIRGLTPEDIGRITSLNARRLFGIPAGDTSPKIVYPIRQSLYINLTNRCSNNCSFCGRQSSWYVKGHNLKLEREPAAADVLAAVERELAKAGRPAAQNTPEGSSPYYREVVFCGYGEPFLRLDTMAEAAKALKEAFGMKIRINTNGQANLIYGRPILPEIAPWVDAVSVSLNAEDEDKYLTLCNPQFGSGTYGAVLDFIRQAAEYIAEVTVTAVTLPGVNLAHCGKISKDLGAQFRPRVWCELG